MSNNKQFSVTKDGVELDPSKYTWDEETRTFSTSKSGLVLDFRGWDGVTFKTGYGCMFKTGWDCTFNTGGGCTFRTAGSCTFKTLGGCTFNTMGGCTFNTTGGCTFETGGDCTFDTGGYCTFNTLGGCTFNTLGGCTFKAGRNSVIVCRDVFEVITLENGGHIRLKDGGGYEHIKDYEDMTREELIEELKKKEGGGE